MGSADFLDSPGLFYSPGGASSCISRCTAWALDTDLRGWVYAVALSIRGAAQRYTPFYPDKPAGMLSGRIRNILDSGNRFSCKMVGLFGNVSQPAGKNLSVQCYNLYANRLLDCAYRCAMDFKTYQQNAVQNQIFTLFLAHAPVSAGCAVCPGSAQPWSWRSNGLIDWNQEGGVSL